MCQLTQIFVLGNGEYLDKCLYAFGKDADNNTMTYYGCLPKSEANSCGKTFEIQGALVTGCCCDTLKCNDADFAARCGSSSYVIQMSLSVLALAFIFAGLLIMG